MLAVAAVLLKARTSPTSPTRTVYAGVLVFLVAGLAVGGHLGGELTRGDGYLTRYMPDTVRAWFGLPLKEDLGRLADVHPEEAGIDATLVQPALEARCVACHNADLNEGDLALDTSNRDVSEVAKQLHFDMTGRMPR